MHCLRFGIIHGLDIHLLQIYVHSSSHFIKLISYWRKFQFLFDTYFMSCLKFFVGLTISEIIYKIRLQLHVK
jgi:hypothetical protein